MSIDLLYSTLNGYQFQHTSELELQDGVALVLVQHEMSHEREALLEGRDRIDFLVGTVGVEIKVDGSLSLVTRQIHRYLQCSRVESLLLLTSRQKHSNLPETIQGKRIRVLWVSSL